MSADKQSSSFNPASFDPDAHLKMTREERINKYPLYEEACIPGTLGERNLYVAVHRIDEEHVFLVSTFCGDKYRYMDVVRCYQEDALQTVMELAHRYYPDLYKLTFDSAFSNLQALKEALRPIGASYLTAFGCMNLQTKPGVTEEQVIATLASLPFKAALKN
jgi:hypothetical protein